MAPATVLPAFIALLASLVSAQSEPSYQKSPERGEIHIHASADEVSQVLGVMPASEKLKPIAESHGAGGVKWYLVRSGNGITGWIRRDGEQTKKIEVFFRDLPPEPSLAIGLSTPASAHRGAVAVQIKFVAGAVLVPVTFNGSTTANLVLDTGATRTMITPVVAGKLRIPYTGTSSLRGIGGTVQAQTAHVDSVKVGDAVVGKMPIVVHDPFGHAGFEGLLGMDFLGHFQVSVDPAKGLLLLNPR